MKRVRTLVVDDEPLARSNLLVPLRRDPGIELLRECGSGAEALTAIHTEKPDLVFLDVEMPECDGFDVLEMLGADAPPAIVFVTAYDGYALRAFAAGALDYLLKPFSDERFEIALARARRRLEDAELRRFGQEALRLLARSNARAEPAPGRLLVRTGTGTQVVPIDEIDAAVGAGVYVALRVRGRELLHRASLSDLGSQLGERFVRVHRSTIVNLDAIVRFDALSHGEFELTLRHGERVRASRTYRAALERALGPLS